VSSRKRKPIDPLEQAIETALAPGSFISYKAAWSFVDDVQEVAKEVDKVIESEPERAASLYETFIAVCNEKADEIDDSSGKFGMLVNDLFHGWIKARQAAGADGDEKAKSLLTWMDDPRNITERAGKDSQLGDINLWSPTRRSVLSTCTLR